MIAVDTNVLIRLITQDHKEQSARAVKLFRQEHVWIARTVLLETGWVLQSLYGFTDRNIADALRKLAGLANVNLEDPLGVAQALLWFEAGMDFADALHLASCPPASSFGSFDARLLKRAARLGVATHSL